MAEAHENDDKKISVFVKTPKEKQQVEVSESATVKQFRVEVSRKYQKQVEQICLIFAGKILKDEETLAQHGIKDGLTVHLVIKSINRTADPPPPSTGSDAQQPDVSQTPFGLGALGGLGGMGSMGMGSGNFGDMQQRLQREMMQNPEVMQQMMNNPLISNLMSNPDVMRQLITSNPQMRELMERNPEISHMLNNPELMRQTMELARNPAMLQELMRSQDRAMSNLESLPGGFNALQRMYRDVQEPMLSAASEGLGRSNPFAGLQQSSDTAADQQGRESNQPMPNPWGGSTTGGGGSNNTATSSTTSSTTSSSTPAGGAPNMSGSLNSPGMQSLMSQMVQNPQLMQNMMQAPYMQSMLQGMAANPELAQQVMASNPMFAGNPQLQEAMRAQMPMLLQQMQNPEVQNLMSNPRAMQAMMQIQQGMQQLQQEAPGLMGSANMPPGVSTPPQSAPTASTTASTTPQNTPSQPSSGGAPPAGAPPGGDPYSNMMAQMVNMMSSGNINQPPEQRYATQLETLAAMGFVDRQANIQALTATFGDVNAAIDRLLQSSGGT